jgi:RNase P/RNase MRP subunit POP5
LKTVRRRYLALQVDSAESFSSNDLMSAVWNAVTKLHGECGASQASLSLISYELQAKFAVVRVGHKAVEMVRASLASITSIAGKPAAVHVIRASGTIKALRKKTKL